MTAQSSSRGTWLSRLWSIPTGAFGLSVLAVLVIVAALSLVWTPFDPTSTNPADRFSGPSLEHLLGTDGTGRDMLSQIMVGAQATALVAAGAAVVSTLVGALLASLAALTPRWVRESMATLIDILVAFPVLLIAMMLSAIWGGSLLVVIVAVGIGFGVNIARVTRPELRRVLGSDFVLAARASGLTGAQTLRRHLVPNVAPLYIVQLSWSMGVAVLAEAGLSYLGLGAAQGEPSWGLLLSDTQQYITLHPSAVLWPGLAITVTVLAVNLLGDGVRDATDPTLATLDRAHRRAARKARVR